MEGLTDRQAADAVRRWMDWKYAPRLDLTDPGFACTRLHDFRERLLTNRAAQRRLDPLLNAGRARGLIKPRGTQRTDSTHVLAAVRTLHHLECILETMHLALNRLTATDAEWVRQRVPAAWFDRYGLRAAQSRLPKETRKREALAQTIGTDGYQLLEWLFAAHPAGPGHRDLLPGIDLLDSGYVASHLLVTAHQHHQIDLVGPPFGSYSRQRLAGRL